MKIRDILLPASFAFLCIYFAKALETYLTAKNPAEAPELRAGQSLIAPKKEQLIKPLLTDVDFLESDVSCSSTFHTVTSERLIARYASCGGVIAELIGRKIPGIEQKDLTFIQSAEDRHGAFLVALQDKTPLSYELVSEKHDDGMHSVTFRTKTDTCIIEKEFTLFDASYRIDMHLTIDPLNKEGVHPRILVPSPSLQLTGATDTVQGIMFNDAGALEKKSPEALENRLWVMPSLFGTEDRYFINALITDASQFVQRAYYKVAGVQKLVAILEGPVVQQKTSWKLSFYCGPKQIEAMRSVDSRLDAALDYGWLAPISKIGMRVLNGIYRYVGNYGWAIVLLTLLIKLLLVPFSWRAEKSAKRAAEMKKKLQYIEQKYKHDPETLTREKAELIKKSGLFDVGCLSVFIQLPVLLALQKMLSVSIELYKAPFVGWIKDLSAIDPFYVLPALAGLGIFMHAGMAGDARQRMVALLMALVVGGVLMNVSAGLVLFICASTWLSIIQSRVQKALKLA